MRFRITTGTLGYSKIYYVSELVFDFLGIQIWRRLQREYRGGMGDDYFYNINDAEKAILERVNSRKRKKKSELVKEIHYED